MAEELSGLEHSLKSGTMERWKRAGVYLPTLAEIAPSWGPAVLDRYEEGRPNGGILFIED